LLAVRHDPAGASHALHRLFGYLAGLLSAFAQNVAEVVRLGRQLVVFLARLGETLVYQLREVSLGVAVSVTARAILPGCLLYLIFVGEQFQQREDVALVGLLGRLQRAPLAEPVPSDMPTTRGGDMPACVPSASLLRAPTTPADLPKPRVGATGTPARRTGSILSGAALSARR